MVKLRIEIDRPEQLDELSLFAPADKFGERFIDGLLFCPESPHALGPLQKAVVDLQVGRHGYTIVHT